MNKTSKPKFPFLATLVAFASIVIMLGLGLWQLDRKLEKEVRLENIAQAAKSEAIALNDIKDSLLDYQDYQVSLQGRMLDNLFYIDNKLRNGQAGFHVLLPYETSVGIVMLDLGWIAAKGLRSELPSVDISIADSLEGIIYIPTYNSLVKETNVNYGEFPVLLQQIDLSEIKKHLKQDILPINIRMLPDNSYFVREWEAMSMSPEKHLGYAVQWFGLAVAALTVYLLSMLKWMQGSPSVKSD